MDLLTHGLLGGTLAQACSKKGETRAATTVGFLAALLADADALIQSSAAPLLTLEYHRQFTHSLIFIPFGALLVTLILWPAFKAYGHPLGFLRGSRYPCPAAGRAFGALRRGARATHLLWPF